MYLFIGVILAAEETTAISENSNMTRELCVRLASFGGGLEREVTITLKFNEEGFATKGIICMIMFLNSKV